MQLLFISQYYYPEIGAGSARITGLAENLVRLGHGVTVITGFPNYPTGVVPPQYRGQLFMRESINGVEVLRTWMFTSAKRTSMRRLLSYLSFALSATVRGLLAKGRFDGVFSSSPPLFVGFSALLIAKKNNVPYIFDIRDIWPEIAISLGEIQEKSAVARLAGWLEAKLYSNAAKISVVTPGKFEKLTAKGVPSEKLFILSNGVDDDFLVLPCDLVTRKDLGLDEEDFVVTYAGTIGLAQGLGILLDAADQLSDNPTVKFLIIGEGVEKQALIEKATAAGLASVRFLPLQPKHKMPSILRISDAAFVPLKSGILTDSVPSKLYEYLGVGCPVILAANGDACDLVRKAEAGVVVEPNNVEMLVEAIMDLSTSEELREQYVENGKAYVRQHFLRSNLAKLLEEEFVVVVA